MGQRQQETKRCPHCGNPFIVSSHRGEFDRHVKNCRGKTPPGPLKRRDAPNKKKDKRGHR